MYSALLQRFLRYVAIDTQSDPEATTYPSSEKQKELCRLLVQELRELGLSDAEMDAYGYVLATVPANVEHDVPVIGLIAHVDTSPEMSGANVRPQIHANYQGGAIELGNGHTLTPEMSPALAEHHGHTLITSDGATLLGADDKAGIAEIVTFVERLKNDPSIKHGKLRIAFTMDEEVGRGTEHFDLEAFGADYAYTVDGEAPGEVVNETFCADSATVQFMGVNVHPGYAKERLVNSAKAAAHFIELLPKELAPESTDNRRGYVHPVHVVGNVESTVLKLILRDFELGGLQEQRALLKDIAAQVRRAFPGAAVVLSFQESYRNMRLVLEQHPHVVENAVEAVRRAGLKPRLGAIRGGTDGALLSQNGLPTPNIFAGGRLFHSRYEWIALEAMEQAVDTLVQLVQVWTERAK